VGVSCNEGDFYLHFDFSATLCVALKLVYSFDALHEDSGCRSRLCNSRHSV
jgi:hypothetical protein